MDDAVLSFFSKMPQALPLFLKLSEKLCAEYPAVSIKIQKTQIAFSDKRNFALVWIPIRKMKDRPDVYIIVSFFLPYCSNSSRIVQAVEPYPGRWTHHIIISGESEIDSEFMELIRESYTFMNGPLSSKS